MTTESSPEALAERAFHVDGVLTRVRLRNLPPPEVLADPAWATVRDIELVESPRLIDAWKDCAWFLGLRSALGLGRSGVEQATMLGARFSGISMLPNPTFIGQFLEELPIEVLVVRDLLERDLDKKSKLVKVLGTSSTLRTLVLLPKPGVTLPEVWKAPPGVDVRVVPHGSPLIEACWGEVMLVLGLAAVAGEPDTEAFCYASGLRVAHERIQGRAVASALTRVTAGSRTEPEELAGLAHLVEHLWFKSSFGDGSVRQALDAMGARFNAQTDRDTIVYETTVPARSFDDLLALEAHRARQGPLVGVPDEELERERAIVRSERLFRDAGGMRGVYETLLADLLAGSAYGHSVSGTDATLDAIDLQAAREWAERHHHAGSQSMLLVSPNPHAKVREAVEAHFGNLASESVPCRPRQEPASQAVPAAWTARTVTLPVNERTLAFAWALPPTGPVPLALDVAVAGTLAREMDESATCSAIGLDAVAVVACRMPWPEGDAPLDDLEGLEKVWRIDGPAMLGEGGPAFARSHVATRITRLDDVSAEGSDRLLEKLTMFHHTGRTDHLAGLELAVQKMSPDWFRGHLNKVMPAGQRVALVVEPNGEANAGLAVHPERRSRPAPSVLPEDLAALPKPEVHTATLPNGLALTAIRLQGLPVTRVALVLPGGTLRADDPAVDVAARARLQSIDRPLQDLAAARKATWQDGDDGWDWRIASTDTTAPYRLLAKRLEQVGMQGGRLAEMEPDVDLEELGARKEHLGLPSPSWEEVRGVSKGAAAKWAKSVVTPVGAHLVVVGPSASSYVEEQALAALGGWEGKAGPPLRPPAAVGSERALVFADDLPNPDAKVIWSCPIAHSVEAEMLAAALEDRLTTELREELGLAYAVGASVGGHDAPALMVSTIVPEAHVGVAVDHVQKAFAALADGAVDPAELTVIRQRAALHLATELGSGDAWLTLAVDAVRRGVPVESVLPDVSRLTAADGPALAAAAKSCGAPLLTVVGGVDAVKASLASVGVEAVEGR